MGYYSEVALVLSEKGLECIENIIKVSGYKNDINQLLDDADKKLERNGCILYSWTSVKWYNVYPEVAFIQHALETQIPQEDFYFVRVGESISDIEELGDFYDNPFSLRPVCEVSFS